MQRFLFSLCLVLGAAFLVSSAQAEETPHLTEVIPADAVECTTQANEEAQATAEASEDGGDAQALFYVCMARKGYTQGALEAYEEE